MSRATTAAHGSVEANLQVTPIYDMKVKGNDLVLATHGRGFWIAEELPLLYQPLLRAYHEPLTRQGVSGYRWVDCWTDYGECVIVTTLIPIGQFRRHMPARVIWYGMEQSVAAFNDLACAELL